MSKIFLLPPPKNKDIPPVYSPLNDILNLRTEIILESTILTLLKCNMICNKVLNISWGSRPE